MDQSKERFIDFVNEFSKQVKENRESFLRSEEESEKVLQSKLAKNIDFREKIEERLQSRTEKHELSIQKSTDVFKEKEEKIKENHAAKLEQITLQKDKSLESVESKLEKEKSKLEKTLASLDKKYIRDEKKCLSEIEKAEKKADSYSVENLVNRTEKDGQNKLKSIQSNLSKSLARKTQFTGEIKSLIDQLKNLQAQIETVETESKSRFLKLKQRAEKEELLYQASVSKLEQTTLREEIRSLYDLDKIITNYDYNITHETLKTEERKIDLEYKMNLDQEEFRYYQEKHTLRKDRTIQLENEHFQLESIIQKDKSDNVKNNFALSNKEHKNLQIYMKSVHDNTKELVTTNYKLAIEEIDTRSKHAQDRIKVAISDLKTTLDHLLNKVKTNLKTELKMPHEQIKLVQSKHKQDTKDLTKMYESKIKELNDKLVFLDQTFDQEEIKEVKSLILNLENRQKHELSQLENDFSKIIKAYESKIEYANKRSETIQEEAQKVYQGQLERFNKELERIKVDAEKEKEQVKHLLDKAIEDNKNHLDFSQHMNQLATNQNDEIMTDLVDLSQSNIDTAEQQANNRNQKTEEKFEKRIEAKKIWLSKNTQENKKELNSFEVKLQQYIKTIQSKLEKEKKDVEKHITKLKAKLKRNLNDVNKEYKKVTRSFEKAMKDAELEYDRQNKKLLNDQMLLQAKLEELAQEHQVEVTKEDFDIYASKKKKELVDTE